MQTCQDLAKFLAINHRFLAKIKNLFYGLKENTKNLLKLLSKFWYHAKNFWPSYLIGRVGGLNGQSDTFLDFHED